MRHKVDRETSTWNAAFRNDVMRPVKQKFQLI